MKIIIALSDDDSFEDADELRDSLKQNYPSQDILIYAEYGG